jgi:hypothetical protein
MRPGFTVETLAQDGARYSDNPTFRKEFQHIVDGARTASLPEGSSVDLKRAHNPKVAWFKSSPATTEGRETKGVGRDDWPAPLTVHEGTMSGVYVS